jgi:dipeptidyl aminopeptidase/acylaminoacyl peptidase
MIPESAGLDRQCPTGRIPKVAAIINWFGISDVNDLLEGPNLRPYAVAWFAGQSNRDEIARRVSPLTYVREGGPPTISIHGDADPAVPYTQSVRLHEALTKVKVPNQLVTVPKAGHGGFPREERIRIYAAICEFLARNGLPVTR